MQSWGSSFGRLLFSIHSAFRYREILATKLMSVFMREARSQVLLTVTALKEIARLGNGWLVDPAVTTFSIQRSKSSNVNRLVICIADTIEITLLARSENLSRILSVISYADEILKSVTSKLAGA